MQSPTNPACEFENIPWPVRCDGPRVMPTTDLCLQTESSASPVRALPGQDIAQHGCTTQREPRRPGIGARDRKPIDRLHPGHERHAKLRSQGPFWFLGNLHFFTISIGFVGPGMGLSAAWTALAGALGVMFGTVFMAFHGSQAGDGAAADDPVARAVRLPRRRAGAGGHAVRIRRLQCGQRLAHHGRPESGLRIPPPWRSPSSSRAACWRSTGTT